MHVARALTPIDADLGRAIVDAAAGVMADYRARRIRFQVQRDAPPPRTSDCSRYVADVLRRAGLPTPYLGTWELEGSRWYVEVATADARAGDVIWQPGHMGIYTGDSFRRRGKLGHIAYEMTRRGPWRPRGEWGPAGRHAGGDFTAFYRPGARR